MIKKITVETRKRNQMININQRIIEVIDESNMQSGLCILYVPHTTASVTINENDDPNVQVDLMLYLSQVAPEDGNYKHKAGNGDSHIKSSIIGNSTYLFIEDGALLLGTWQAIFFCEFDGPRSRQLFIKLIEDS